MKKDKILFIIVVVETVVIFMLVMGNVMNSKLSLETCSLLNCTTEDCTFEECAIHATTHKYSYLNKKDRAIVNYSPNEYVNFRSEPKAGPDYIKGKINNGAVVEILEDGDTYSSVSYNGETGYIINESFERISSQIVLFDVSDYQWGSEYSSKEEYREFLRNAQNNCNFGGVYIQVQNSNRESSYWKTLVEVHEEEKIPYGLYFYTVAKTRDATESDYNKFIKHCNSIKFEMEYNLLPIMIDIEDGNQVECLKYMNEVCKDEYIFYSGANKIANYKYYNYTDNIWVAHYSLNHSPIPNNPYEGRIGSKQGFIPKIWQYTDLGHKSIFGTSHLDVNVVNEEWYRSYVK